MQDSTLQEIYNLAGYEPDVIVAQCQWSATHIRDTEACKLAAFEWGRKVKPMAFAWEHYRNELKGGTRHQIMSLILIAGMPKLGRDMLYEQWRDTTMSYEQVRDAVDSRKQRKPRAPKAQPAREELGKLVRRVWVNYCIEIGDWKPSHIAEWDALNESDKEIDCRIGEAVWRLANGNGTKTQDESRMAGAVSETNGRRKRKRTP